MSTLLALKLALVPTLIGGITLAGRKWGPGVAGWLSAFPVVAGPILIFIALDRGNAFAQQAASSTLSAVAAIVVFGLSYAWAALRFNWLKSLACAFAAYAMAVFLLNYFVTSLYVGIPLIVLTLLVAPKLYPTVVLPPQLPPPTKSDLAIRMSCGAVLVLIVTHFSAQLGPRLSGLFAMFPVLASVLAAFTHRQSGAAYAVHLLRGTVLGYYAFASFCIAVALLLSTLPLSLTFTLAFSVALIIQLLSRLLLTRYLKPTNT